MRVKVYDAGKRFEGYVDRYCIYYPYPKKDNKGRRAKGFTLDFSFSEHGITVCCHSEVEIGSSLREALGKRVKNEDLPQHVQKWVQKHEEAYNKALKLDTETAWNEFNRLY